MQPNINGRKPKVWRNCENPNCKNRINKGKYCSPYCKSVVEFNEMLKFVKPKEAK